MTDWDSALAQLTSNAPAQPEADPLDFPPLPENWQNGEVLPPPTRARTPGMDRSDKLEHLIDLSLDKAEELLELPVDPGEDNYVKVASMQKDLVVSLVNAGIKIDDNRFRKKSTEALTSILAQVLDQEKRLAPVVVAPPIPEP